MVFNSGELVRARKKATPMAMSESSTPPRLPRVSYAMGIVHQWGVTMRGGGGRVEGVLGGVGKQTPR